jgi:hypothetical protein
VAAVAQGVVLDALPGQVEFVADQGDHVERVYHGDRVRDRGRGGGLEPGEAIHRDDLNGVPEGVGLGVEPGLEHPRRAALDHVEQPCRAGPVTDRGEVHDHGHEPVRGEPGMSPAMLIDPDHLHLVEPGRVTDQQLASQVGDRSVSGVPGDAEDPGDAGDRDMIEHHPRQRPHPRRPGQPRPPTSHRPQPMPPHLAAPLALVAWGRDLQPGRAVPQRQMREPPQHRVMTPALPTTADME